jgi:hypothetical protein
MKAPDGKARIDDELKAFLESGPSVIVGTRDVGLAPEITRAWGPRVSEDRSERERLRSLGDQRQDAGQPRR